MTAFIVFAGLLVAGALLLILPPLLGVGARRRREAARQSTMAPSAVSQMMSAMADASSKMRRTYLPCMPAKASA